MSEIGGSPAGTRDARENAKRVMEAIYRNPSADGLRLRTAGLTVEDADTIYDLEKQGFIEFKNRGWSLTAKGDRFLMRHTP